MGSFAYVAPKTVRETTAALAELSSAGTPTQIMAGGTDVLVQLRTVNRAARTLVDIKGLAETNRLDIGADETYIGAAIPSAVLNENADLTRLFPGLTEAADLISFEFCDFKHARPDDIFAVLVDVERVLESVFDVVSAPAAFRFVVAFCTRARLVAP